MNRFARLVWLSVATLALSARADTSVVFNEVMYHPATNEPAMEWLELYNQMAVDVDMSGWSIDGDVHYNFGANYVIHGGAFAVVSISPTNLAAVTGLTNILGPFTNRLSNSGGKLQLRNNYGRVVNQVDYDTKGAWPVAPDGSGVSLAKIDHSAGSMPAANWTWSAQVGGTPGKENFPTNVTALPLAFNEFSATTNADFWLELMNYGTNSLGIGSFVIIRAGPTNAEYVLSPGVTLPPRGFLTLSNSVLGFKPTSSDLLFLLPAGRSNVLDAINLKTGARARWPDGTGKWLNPSPVTPGASNSFVFHQELVINEIMYHHQNFPPLATNMLPRSSPEQWIELYNRSSNTVNLTGWTFSGGISYNFPNGKTIAPGAYLVVANNSAALHTNYPSIDIIGDFAGKLAHGGDTLELDDAAGNPVSTVTYSTAGRWPVGASGNGSSLELRDPQADTMNPASWAASDETAKSVWQTNIYQGVASTVVGTDQWNDFLMGLLNDGECLVDDISVIESPGGTPVQFIANGDFESGSTGWRLLGNHMTSRVETEPGNPANHVLHIVAGGVQGDQHDHIESTYTGGRHVTNGRTYQIAYRARWLTGNNMLNTRLYYDRVPKTVLLPMPSLNGTPGAVNSTYATNIGPTFTLLQHKPVIPAVSQSVTVSVAASDPQGVTLCEVWWSANGGVFSHATMTNQGGLYKGTIPGFASGAVVQFYVRGVDGLGAVSTWPAAGSNSGALYMVNDNQADFSQGHNLRVILSPANWALLRANTNLLGNAWLPGTIIYDEQRPYYDMSIRLKGSAYGRVGDPHPSFHVMFQPDDLFRGVHSSMLIDTSGRPGANNQQLEILVHHMMLHAGGIPEIQADLCRCIPPFQTNSMTGVLEPRFEDEFIETAFPHGDDGVEFNMELDYYPTTKNAAGYKLPSPESITGVDITDLGNDKETYRYNFMIKNNRNDDDYTRFIPFAKMMSMPNTPLLDAQSQQLMDMNEWLRVYAMVTLVGESDWYSFGNPHNILIYNRPDDNKMMVFPWDVEQLFFRSGYPDCPIIGPGWDWSDLESQFPANTRRLYGHIQDIIATTFNTNYMAYWVEHYGNMCGQDFSELLDFIPQRVTAVNAEIAGAGGNAAFSSGTNFIVTANNLITITGTAPVQMQSILINGIAYPVTWNSVSNWSIRVPVSLATNVLNLTAYDLNGNAVTNRTFTVNYTGQTPSPQGLVGFNEIMYNPAITNASYVELYNNSTNLSFDISNWRVNGLSYTFPPGSIITNRQFLTLLKDSSAFINVYGTNLAGFDQFTGNLDPLGETLTLFMPGPQTNSPEIAVDKVKYSPLLPWPATTPGLSLQIRDPIRDHWRVGNWAAAAGTPKATNSGNAALPAFAPLWLNELQADNLTGITNHLGQRTGWFELYNPTTNVVSLTNLYVTRTYTNLTAWAMPTGAVINPGQFKVIFTDGQTNNATSNELHTSFVLPSGAGSLALSRIINSQTQTLDFVDYTNINANRSYGSFPDGQSFDRMQFYVVTPGAFNTNTAAPLTVSINEWMAANTHTLPNPTSGKFSDWFELYNYGTNAADLTGYFLTDSLTNQFQFQIPAGYIIPPHGFLIVWADGKSTNGTPDLHVTFKMNKDGESLGLYGVDGTPIDFVNYGVQGSDISEGRFPDGGPTRFFMPTATPQTNNVIPNTPPTLDPIASRVVHFGQTVRFTATAADAEGAFQTLAFSLDPVFPIGASIDPSTGDFTWLANNFAPPSTNIITVRVTDNGTPPMSATRPVTITILAALKVGAGIPSGGLLPLTFNTIPGQNYQVQYKDNLDDPDWIPLGSPVPGTGAVLEVDADMTGQDQRFFRVVVP